MTELGPRRGDQKYSDIKFRSRTGPSGRQIGGRLGYSRPSVGALQHSLVQTGNHPSEEIDLELPDGYLEIVGTALHSGVLQRDKF